ncbi:tissue factor pathway inhibitor [Pipistrellus kuhlii]|uniref:tissue factor pathway inhibitor n=1 Tax=Pipistrellus kuhlii TaxID=59472 RepID=UPI00174EE704|nr:tissue factor pathway inhibitor [Pipistrellus kuhlii]
MDPSPGSCYEIYFRYFYNKTAERCQSFIFTGCDGNLNNYQLKIDCQVACEKEYKIPNTMKPELIRSFMLLLILSMPLRTFSAFMFPQDTRKKMCESGYLGEACNYPAKSGTCKLILTRFYYNSLTFLCEPFIFSGCGGNRNNFKSKHQCQVHVEPRQMKPFLLRVFVNPRLRVPDSRLVTFPEGCESVAGFLAHVPRFQAVQISGLDPRREQVVWQASG